MNTVSNLAEILGNEQPCWVFKHSPICPVSSYAWGQFKAFQEETKANYVRVDVISQKPLSQEIAQFFNIRHESPQVLLIDSKKCLWSESHDGIHQENLKKYHF